MEKQYYKPLTPKPSNDWEQAMLKSFFVCTLFMLFAIIIHFIAEAAFNMFDFFVNLF